MVLNIAYTALSAVLPSKYWFLTFVAIVIVFVIRTFAQGRKTTRERELHARVVLVTVASHCISVFQDFHLL
jgi:uncharacterized membrane protein